MSTAHAQHAERSRALLRTTVLLAVAVVMLYPLLWLVGASFKTNTEIFTEVGFWPSRFDFGSYAKGWKTSTEYTFATYFLNSFLITVPRIVVTVISCVLVAYAFARFEFWGKKLLFSIMAVSYTHLDVCAVNAPLDSALAVQDFEFQELYF